MPLRGLAHHHQAKGDVPDEVAVAGVADRAVVVGQLLQLADVVDDRTGQQQVLAGAVEAGQGDAGRGHRQHVFEESAAIGVVNLLRRGPLAQRRLVVGEDAAEQDAQRSVADAGDQPLQLGPHVADRPRRARHAVVLAETLGGILLGVDAAEARGHQLQLAVVDAGASLDADELADFELLLEALDVLEDAAGHLAAGVLEHERKILAALADAQILAHAQVEVPARLVGLEPGVAGQP